MALPKPRWYESLNWRARRQLGYLAIPIIPTLLIAGYLIYSQATTASCSDGKINQGERGIDCEGPCPKICEARIIMPTIEWSNAFPTLPGTYNLAALIENNNEDLGINDAIIEFTAFNESGDVIYQDKTLFDIRPSASGIAFLGPVQIAEVPSTVKASFMFQDATWEQFENLIPDPIVLNKEIQGTKQLPRVQIQISNQVRQQINDVPVAVAIFDENNNVTQVSNTLVNLGPAGTNSARVSAGYTWPTAFPTTTGVCQQPVDVIMAIDASGSMNSQSIDPPEPLESVKGAARRFAGLFSSSDSLGVISFANDAVIQTTPTSSLDERLGGIDQVIITPEAEVGYTNIAAALNLALDVLDNQPGNNAQAVVLLTDGQPTAPDGAPDAEDSSLSASKSLKASGVNLYAIGLGPAVNQDFLSALVNGDTNRTFKTSNVDELSSIYSQIATAVCERLPYRIEVYPVLPL